MDYPFFRVRQNSEGTETVYFYFKEAGVIGKLKATDTEYIFNGPYNGTQTEQQLINQYDELSSDDWAAGVEDNANMATRVGGRPSIRPPQ